VCVERPPVWADGCVRREGTDHAAKACDLLHATIHNDHTGKHQWRAEAKASPPACEISPVVVIACLGVIELCSKKSNVQHEETSRFS